MWAGAAAKTLIPKISEIEGKHRLIPSDFYTKQVYSSGQLSCTDVFSGLLQPALCAQPAQPPPQVCSCRIACARFCILRTL
jgi:hypothetical protein